MTIEEENEREYESQFDKPDTVSRVLTGFAILAMFYFAAQVVRSAVWL